MKLWKHTPKNDGKKGNAKAETGKKAKTGIKNIDGKYCVYHHGIGVFKHDCGVLLCRECLRDYEKCPSCKNKIDMSKKRCVQKPKKDALRSAPETAKLQKSAPSPFPSLTPASRAISARTSSIGEARQAPGQMPNPEHAPSAAPERKDDAKSGHLMKIDERRIMPAPKQKTMHPSDERETDEPGNMQAPVEETESTSDIFDDDLDSKKRKAFIPSYKRRRHARTLPGQNNEDEEEKDKKKWDVRTVPPVQKKRGYDSL